MELLQGLLAWIRGVRKFDAFFKVFRGAEAWKVSVSCRRDAISKKSTFFGRDLEVLKKS